MTTTTQLYRLIDSDIRRLDRQEGAEEKPLLRLLKVYANIRSLLIVISTLPLLSPAWRSALALFVQLCDTMAGEEQVEVREGFKAGRDL